MRSRPSGTGPWLARVFLAFLACAWAACSEPVPVEPTFPRDRGAIPGGVIHRRLAGAPLNLDPLRIGSSEFEQEVLTLLYDELFALNVDLELDFSHSLAESAEATPDLLELLVRLRQDRRWHDGHPVTVDDFLFSFRLQERIAGLAESCRARFHPDVTSVEKVDGSSLRIRFRRPQLRWWVSGNLWPLPEHIYATEVRSSEGSGRTWSPHASPARPAIGTGPYRLVEYPPGGPIVLERREDYAGSRTWVDRFVLEIVESDEEALDLFLAGRLDETRLLPGTLADAGTLAEIGRLGRPVGRYGEASVAIVWNIRRAPLDDPGVRTALAAALDLDTMIDTRLAGEARPAAQHHPFDPAAAEDALRGAGYRRSGDPGVWSGEAGPLRFELLHEPDDAAAAQAIAGELTRFGIEVAPRSLPRHLVHAKTSGEEFQAALISLAQPGARDDDEVLVLWHPRITYAVSDRIGGFVLSPRGPFAFHPGQRGWWARDAATRY